MKKACVKVLFFVLVVIIVMCAGCTSVEKPVKVDGTESVTVNSEGEKYNNGLCFVFDGEEKGYTLESPKAGSIHDSSSCEKCGYTEYNGKKVFKICSDKRAHNGFLIKFTTPLKASSFAGATIECMTSANASNSEIRLLRANETKSDLYINDDTFLENTKDNWKNINIGIKDFNAFSDKEGNIEGIQFFVRNKDNIELYISELTLKIDSEELCTIDITDSCFYEKGAVEAIATQIKDNFENANLSAEIKVDCVSYLQNTTKDKGEIVYNAEVTMSNGKFFAHSMITKTIPSIHNDWLEDNDSLYGSKQELDSGWEDNFTNAGILKIYDHKISCLEGLKKVQYAVVNQDEDYKNVEIKWYDAQKLVLNKEGIKSMTINPFLDYGSELVNGNSYRLIVRGVSNNDNYIKHIDKSFVYKEYSADKNNAIISAFNKIKDIEIFGESADVTEDFVKGKIEEKISDSKVSVVVKRTNVAASTTHFNVGITYADKEFSDCYGDEFMLADFVVWNNQNDSKSSIMPVSPADGEKNIIIASDYIYDLADATYSEFTNVGYGYINGEECTPPPVKLEWTDTASTGKYTVFVSENADFSGGYEFSTDELYYDVYNLKVGTKYYWKVSSGNITSPVFCFKTEGGYPRFIKADGVSNMRDIGGYITKDGKIVKQGLVYRSGSLDDITATSKKDIAYMLNIKTDLDLRGGTGSSSPLGKDVTYIPQAMQWYHGIFNSEAEPITAESVRVFADESNYPIDFHCSLGRDRTGTLSMILLGLLGVEEETILREYHFSFFAKTGGFEPNEFTALQTNLSEFKRYLAEYGDENATFNERVEAYMLSIGVTAEEINSIRNILLEDAPPAEEVVEDKVKFDNSKDSSKLVYLIVGIAAAVVAAVTGVVLFVFRKRRKA